MTKYIHDVLEKDVNLVSILNVIFNHVFLKIEFYVLSNASILKIRPLNILKWCFFLFAMKLFLYMLGLL